MTWQTVKLGELARVRTGKLDANAADENGLYPFFTCAVEPLSINTPAFDCKAILVAGNGDLNVKYYEGKFNAYQRTYVIESLDEKILLPRYLYLFLNEYVNELRALAIGGVIKYIKLANLTDALIPLPPLKEQQRIATILERAESIRLKREMALRKLDELIQSTFIEMFGDVITNSKKWQLTKLKNVTVFENGDRSSNYPSGDQVIQEGVLFLSTKNIINNKLNLNFAQYISEQKFTSLSRGKAKRNDLIITLRGTLGSCCIFDQDRAFINAQMMIIRSKNEMDPHYLHALLTSKAMHKYLQEIGNGAAVKQLTASQLGDLLIPVPPLLMQIKFKEQLAVINTAKKISLRVREKTNQLISSLKNQTLMYE